MKGRIYIAGHTGMVGGALVRKFEALPGCEILTVTRAEVDLTEQHAVRAHLQSSKPDVVLVAAARVGGIQANRTYPADFLYVNLMLECNLIQEAFAAGVQRVLFLGSSCIYPRMAEQPMREDALLTGPLEPTNEAYAMAKIAGLKLCQFYRQQHGVGYHSAMPTNLYGPGDNYHPENSHVIPALLRRFHEAKQNAAPSVSIWGSGTPLREFLHVDDLADACVHLLALEDPPDWVNVGSGEEVRIGDLATLVAKTVGYTGEIRFDSSKPDGSPRKLMDSSILRATGWRPNYPLEDGLAHAYRCFLEELASGNLRQV